MKKITEVRSLPCFIRANPRLFAVFRLPPSNDRGIALVMTLTLLAILLIMLLAFVTSMRTERLLTKNFNDLAKARLLADAAVERAVAMIRDATPVPRPPQPSGSPPGRTWTAAPGVIYQAEEGVGITTNWLFSTGSGDTFNINESYFITGKNSLYGPTPPASPAPIKVEWQNVTLPGGELIGRYGFWVDNEMAKVNINTAKMRLPADINQSNPTNVDFRALEPPLYNTGIANLDNIVAQRQYTATTKPYSSIADLHRGISMTSEEFDANKFFMTVSTVDTNTDVFGRDKIDINNISDSDIADPNSLIRQRLNDDSWAKILYPTIVDPVRDTLEKKYGVYGIEQILANLVEYKKPYVAGDPAVGANDRDGNNIPRRFCGLKQFPLLGEILVQAAATNEFLGGNQYQLTVSVYTDARLVNPYGTPRGSGGRVIFDVQSIDVETAPPGIITSIPGGLKTRPITANIPAYLHRHLNSTGNIISDTATMSKYSASAVFTGTQTATVTRVIVRMKSVRLLRTTSDASIQDWATPKDFLDAFPGGMEFGEGSPDGGRVVGDYYFLNLAPGTRSPQFPATGSGDPRAQRLGIAKNDPRVRTFPDHAGNAAFGKDPPKAWFKVLPSEARPTGSSAGAILSWVPSSKDPTFTQNHYGLLVDNRDIHPGTGGGAVPTQGRQSTYFIKEAPFEMFGELSAIHTGYQWRNVRLRSSVAYDGTNPIGNDPNRPTYLTVEQKALPDWILFDIFRIGNDTVPGRINLNSQFKGPASSLPPRWPPYAALINASTTNLAAGATSEAQMESIAQNIANRQMATGSLYKDPDLPAYFTPGEYCEVFDLDYFNDPRGGGSFDANPSKMEREQMIRRISNLVTARSNVFTVWGMAQSIKDVNKNGTFDDGTDIITGEVKVQAIVERYEDPTVPVTDPSRVKFRTLYFRYLYD